MRNVMIDLETMSLSKTAAIISIGAVEFDLEEETLGKEFYQNVELSSCIKLGLTREIDTLNWWAKPENKEARDSLTKNAMDIEIAIPMFLEYCAGDIIPWSNGATFDIVILEHAIKTCRHKVPWKYYNESCMRTFKRLYPSVIVAKEGLKHNALSDAKNQARLLMRILNSLKLSQETTR